MSREIDTELPLALVVVTVLSFSEPSALKSLTVSVLLPSALRTVTRRLPGLIEERRRCRPLRGLAQPVGTGRDDRLVATRAGEPLALVNP